MFARNYLEKNLVWISEINNDPISDLGIVVTIPSFNEPEIIPSLNSIFCSDRPACSVEIITVFNASENANFEEKSRNIINYKKAIEWALNKNTETFKYHFILNNNLPHKDTGVGLARKIGMDTALSRFNKINFPNGIITGFDSDSTCSKNYFTEIYSNFLVKKPDAASINFEHPLEGNNFSKPIYNAIIDYELHLRYFYQALKWIQHPHAYHTIGSAFAVTADTYAKHGGMNKKKAGEDFYFLQKIIPSRKYIEINNASVYPSPRASDRVPFGTGASVTKLISFENQKYKTYQLNAFIDLKYFFSNIGNLYHTTDISSFLDKFSNSIQCFLKPDWEKQVTEIKTNSSSLESFVKRFFNWFNVFKVIKFLNESHSNGYYTRLNVDEMANQLLILQKKEQLFYTAKELLIEYRKMEKNN